MTGLIMKYFVVKPEGSDPYAQASREAMRAYAHSIDGTNHELAFELIEWVVKEEANAGGQ